MVVPIANEPVPPVVGDEALLQRLRDGDASGGEALVKRYCQPLMRYLQRLAGDQMAEELHQQTWLSVLDHVEKFDPASNSGGFKRVGSFALQLIRPTTFGVREAGKKSPRRVCGW